jgi:hypothetical protein
LWKKDTIIIGSGRNALDAYQAISSEKNLGFKIQYFIGNEYSTVDEIQGNPVIKDNVDILKTIKDKSIQFIIALENEQEELRDSWMRNLAKYHFRNVSVIPTTRGLPLYGTDMAFILATK